MLGTSRSELKGQCHKIFCSRFFFMNHIPPSPSFRVCFKNSQRYSQVKLLHRYQHKVANLRGINDTGSKFATDAASVVTGVNYTSGKRHQWQLMGTISDCLHLKVNMKKKVYLYVNSTIQRCTNKIFKTFLIGDFSICHQCQRHRWCTLSCKYLLKFCENI
jgi:hypothetical protein